MVKAYFADVWNRRRFDLASRYVHPRVVLLTVPDAPGANPPAVPDVHHRPASPPFRTAKLELRDIVVNDSAELGTRVAVFWVLRGHYAGVPTYGPVTGSPVQVLGASHFELLDGKILREWRLYDELSILAQITAAQG